MAPRTTFDVLKETAQRYGDAPALFQPYQEGGERKYHVVTWNDYQRAAEEIAAGLRSLGIGIGDIVALDSETRMEFYLADLGIMANGSIAAAMYPSYPPRDLIKTVQLCGAKAVFVEDLKALNALRGAPARHWILMTGQAEGALSLDQLRQKGRDFLRDNPGFPPAVDPDAPAILYLTSGATGEPKMALVTHAAITSNLDMGPHVLPLTPQDRTVAFLPSAHIAQRVVIELLPIRCGMPVHFSESLLKLPQDIRAVKPTLLLAPPRMWERIYTTICTELRKRPVVARKTFYGALALGLAAARYRRHGKPIPARIRIPLSIADRVVFRKVRDRFGGQITVAASGAAPLGKELAEFYEAIGMPLVEGYGLTEGGVASLNPLDAPRPGSIGKPLPGVEVKIAADGELLIKSPCLFREYYQDADTTAEVLRDGWLHTGDIGYFDSDGFLFITGRKKELIVSSTGKKIYPSRVENLFKLEPLISQVVLIGDRLPYLTALITINPAIAETLKDTQGLRGEELAACTAVTGEVQRIVARVNKQLAPFEQVRRWRILNRDFSIEEGELTATMKVRRTRVLQNFKGHIDELYAGAGKEA